MDIPFDTIGFDLDGTLFDTAHDLGEAVNHALTSEGRPPVPLDAVARLIGAGSRRMLERALEDSGGLAGMDFDAVYARLIDHYRDHIAVHTRPYPGALAALDALAQGGAHIALVTNKPEALAEQLMNELGESARFACLIGGDTLPTKKPDPAMLHDAMRRCGSTRFAYVGDTVFDVDAAARAGVPCVAVSWGFGETPARELGADAVIDRFDQLIPALTALGRGERYDANGSAAPG